MHDSSAIDQRSRRITSGALIFILGCMLSTARIVRDAPKPNRPPDSAQGVGRRSDQRFAALKASLPERGVIGYLGEPGAAALGDYYLTQYALAPLVVDYSPNHPLVVANFPSSPARGPTLPQSESLQLVKDFGDGVLLFANKSATKGGN
jgi:hypothetical protein